MKNTEKHIRDNFKHAKILIVEDNDDQWLVMQQALRECMSEVRVERVSTIEQTVTLLNEWRHQEWEIPKLILLDLYLPDIADGLQLLKQIRGMTTAIGKIPIVMLTSSAERTDVEQAYQLGISAYMVKPIKFADWLSCFHQLRTYWWETVTLPRIEYGL